jgi:hypothetical protein
MLEVELELPQTSVTCVALRRRITQLAAEVFLTFLLSREFFIADEERGCSSRPSTVINEKQKSGVRSQNPEARRKYNLLMWFLALLF